MAAHPLLIFDGRCGFCRIWIEYWRQLTQNQVDYEPSQEAGPRFPQIPAENFSRSVQLVMPDGEVLSGAQAVFTTLTFAPGYEWLKRMYDHLPGFAAVTELSYRVIAAHRDAAYQLTRFTFGRNISPRSYARVEWLFLKLLAVIYFIAFASFGWQSAGLVGERGILPAGRYLAAVSAEVGVSRYWMMPGIFWVAHSDFFLKAACIAGAAIAIVLFFGYFERTSLAILYVLYLSVCTIGQEFLSFQWDILLLEAGFLAMFLGSSKWIVLLFRWLLFRLMFLSGAVKMMSHDTSWRNLTALSFHYMTQPLPTPLAWYMYQLPMRFQRLSTGAVLVTELAIPFLIFAPRLWRWFAAASLGGLQALMILTGNYTFFNLLTLALCLFLLDDSLLEKLRVRRRERVTRASAVRAITAIVAVLSGIELAGMFFDWRPEPLNSILSLESPFGIVNTYGLFAVMTTTRPEIIVQGSMDGETWLDYEFPFKPGDLSRAPRWVAPYQPRLDWQMWFAALSGFRGAPWFGSFMVQLLEGSPEVNALLEKNPFPQAPPRYVRALLFNYSFTDSAERRSTGHWWKREPRGIYLRAVSMDDVRR